MENRRDIESLLRRLENVNDLDASLKSDITNARSSLDSQSWDDVRNQNLLFRQKHAGNTRVNGQDVMPLTGAESAQLKASKLSGAIPPELDYRALKSLSELQKSQREAQALANMQDVHSSFYTPQSADGSPREIQMSIGDVEDGYLPLADAKYAGGKTFLPPPPIKDVSRQPTNYVLNEAGRQAQATLAGKIAPPEIPQQVIDAIFNRGGNANPQTGQFDVNAPQQQKIDPLLLAAGKQNIRNADLPEEVGRAYNEAQTSATLSMQPQGPPPIASQMPQRFAPQAPIVPPAFSDQQPQRMDQYQQFLANARGRFPNMTEAQIRTAYFKAGGE